MTTNEEYNPQDPEARPLTERQQEKLKGFIHPKLKTQVVKQAWTENPYGGRTRTIWVRLKPGFNYEGRGTVLGDTISEVIYNLANVEEGSGADE